MTAPVSSSHLARNLSSKRHEESGFDGNRTDIMKTWFFPNDKWVGPQEVEDGLMKLTADGYLQWALFLPYVQSES